MPATTPELHWLFSAHFDDGSVIVQDPEDRVSTPEGIELKHNGSSMTDVVAAQESGRKLICFELHHTERDEHLTVDLTTGAFVLNGTPFELHDPGQPVDTPPALFFEREVQVHRVLSLQDGSEVGRQHFINRYHLGWTTTVDGAAKRVTVAIGGA